MAGEKNSKTIELIIPNPHNYKQMPVWKNVHFWHIAILMLFGAAFYYTDVIIDLGGWVNLRGSIFYTVHDLHRALFFMPVMYAAYKFRVKGVIVTDLISLLVFLPRALLVSPYPDPLLRALIFIISMGIMGTLLALLLNNISERKQLEQNLRQTQNDALHETRDYLSSLISYANAPIMAWNKEQLITIFNGAFERLTGYTSSQILGQPISMLFSESSREDALSRIKQALDGKHWESEEIAIRHKDGGIRIVLWNSANIYDKNGVTLLSTIAQGQDITGRKQAEEKLRESEDKFKYFFDNSIVGKSITLPDGNVTVNKAFSDMVGYSQDEINRLKWQAITHPDDLELTQRVIDQMLAGEKDSARFIKRFIHKNGSVVWADLSSFLRRDNGVKPLYFMTIIVDITERKQAESQREAALKEICMLNENLEKMVKERTEELQKTITQLEEMNRVFIDRELKMMELKKQIVELESTKHNS